MTYLHAPTPLGASRQGGLFRSVAAEMAGGSSAAASPPTAPSPGAADDGTTRPSAADGLVAGLVAGAAGVLVGHAFDTAKVQQQIGRKLTELPSIGFLYRGIIPPLVSTGAVRSLYFGTYEALRPPMAAALASPQESLSVVFVAGSLTGATLAPLTAPIQRLKLVQQVEGLSLRECVRSLFASSGVSSLMRGMGVHMLLETFGSGCYLATYHAAKRVATTSLDADDDSGAGGGRRPREPLRVRIGCGAIAGISGWVSIYPLDVLRSRIMSAPPSVADGGGGWATVAAVARETVARGGYRAFFSGISLTLLRAAPVAGVVLPVYDTVLDFLARSRASDTSST